MSCLKSTAPINITEKKKIDTCLEKCNLQVDYPNSDCVVTNKGDHLLITYDRSAKEPVIYNNDSLNVSQIRIYRPSLHRFEGRQADAEMVIFHSSTGKNLLICIPITKSSNDSIGGLALSHIFKKALKYAINEDQQTPVSFHSTVKFNLNDFVKKQTPFYSYTGTLMYPPCSGTYNYVVFKPSDAKVTLPEEDLKRLRKLIVSSEFPVKENEYFVNKGGARSLGINGDEIYIKCNPTGADGEVLEEFTADGTSVSSDSGAPLNWNDLIKNPVFEIVLGVIGVSVLVLVFRGVLGSLKRQRNE